MNNGIEKLLQQPVSWLADSDLEDDIAITTRVRLARNLAKFPFPGHLNPEELQEVLCVAKDIFSGHALNCWTFDFSTLNEADKRLLFERRLVSSELWRRRSGSAVFVREDEALSVMVNEEDHFRLQAILPGFKLEQAFETVSQADDYIAERTDLAFDAKLGYLTSCPTNLGTAMRASVMLHLAGLVLTKKINAAIQGIGQLGFAVRGIFGEGSENLGNLFQLSNQSTLGESEKEILERLRHVVGKLISHEKIARIELINKTPDLLFDHIGRAYGILRHGYLLKWNESLNYLSMLRLGVDMNMFSNVDIHTVNDLFLRCNPAHLQHYFQTEENAPQALNALRAKMVRERLRPQPD